MIGLLMFSSLTSGAPFTSTYTLQPGHDIQARDSPDSANSRTTQGIVWSCIVTIFACTWVTIHPNLPDPRYSKWSQFKQRTAMMMLTIFAPEFILIWALRQRMGARSIMKEYNKTILEGKFQAQFYG